MPLGTEVRLGPGHIVLDGDPALPKREHSPQFSVHVYCGQTVLANPAHSRSVTKLTDGLSGEFHVWDVTPVGWSQGTKLI